MNNLRAMYAYNCTYFRRNCIDLWFFILDIKILHGIQRAIDIFVRLKNLGLILYKQEIHFTLKM